MIRQEWLLGGALLLAAAGLAAAPAASAAPGTAATTTVGVQLPHSREWTMRASGSGREYRVFVAVPEGDAPAQGFPAIYVLDGNTLFLTTAEAVRAQARRRDGDHDRRAVVVGIGYADGVDIAAARTYDLTPDVHEPRARHPTGGAEAFRDFIERDLKPRIAAEYRIDAARQALMGHSFGGLFTVDTLLRRPQAFESFVGMSSSFWFGQHDLARRVGEFASAGQVIAAPPRVLLTAGEFEQVPRPVEWARDPEAAAKSAADLAARGQVQHAREAAKQLAGVSGLLVDVQELAGEDHGSVVPAAVSRAIQFILDGPRVVPPVPAASEYMALGAEGRYRLRMQVRALPDLHRIPWLNGLKASLKQGLEKADHLMLHAERQQMDTRYGSRPHAVNAD